MDDRVRECLGDLIAEHGRNLCASPRVVGMMLRQACPEAEEPIHELELSLSTGCVEPMLAGLPEHADGPALVEKLMDVTGLPIERAQWAIESWTLALMRERPESSGLKRDWSEWNRLDVSGLTGSGTGLYQQAIAHMLIVAATGAMGGAVLGIGVLLREDLRVAPFLKQGLEALPEWARGISLIALGVLGGGAGGLLGWVLGGGRIRSSDPHGGTNFGRYGFAAGWAFCGGLFGAFGGMAGLGLIGVTIGSLLGAFMGAVLGVLAAKGLSRLWIR